MFPTGLLHAVPNDETLSAKDAMKLREKPAKKNGTVATSTSGERRKEPERLCFCPPECLIKSLINPRNVTKMESTFGTWMKDTAQLNDERVWVAEHFSGRTQRTDAADVAEGQIRPDSRLER